MTKFIDLGLAQPLLDAIADEGYDSPTPIQAKAIPVLMDGHDIVGIAQTGTGKTAAFVLPLLDKISRMEGRPRPRTCRALILAPTRELAAQISVSVQTYGKNLNLSSATVVGGVKPGGQIRKLDKGLDVLVATPGRLMDHMDNGAIRLDQTETVILDEADQMLDMGFIPAIRKIMSKLPRERQTMLLSATMPPAIRTLAKDFLTNPTEISVTPNSQPVERITQTLVHVQRPQKSALLIEHLKNKPFERAIVFTRTKRGADKVTSQLLKSGLTAAAIHGNKSQNQRTRALDAFKNGDVEIMVATDIAARGIDIDDVSLVVNYELPNVPEAYVHRIGRTARAGKSGMAITFCDPDERQLLRDIERLIKRQLDVTDVDISALPPAPSAGKGGGAAESAPKKGGGGGGRGRGRSGGGRGRGGSGGGQKASGGGGQGGGGNRNKRPRHKSGGGGQGGGSGSGGNSGGSGGERANWAP